jgi:hypothetical protein
VVVLSLSIVVSAVQVSALQVSACEFALMCSLVTLSDVLFGIVDWDECVRRMQDQQERFECLVSRAGNHYGHIDRSGKTFVQAIIQAREAAPFMMDALLKMPVSYVRKVLCDGVRAHIDNSALQRGFGRVPVEDNALLRRLLDIYARHPGQETAEKEDFVMRLIRRMIGTAPCTHTTTEIFYELFHFQGVARRDIRIEQVVGTEPLLVACVKSNRWRAVAPMIIDTPGVDVNVVDCHGITVLGLLMQYTNNENLETTTRVLDALLRRPELDFDRLLCREKINALGLALIHGNADIMLRLYSLYTEKTGALKVEWSYVREGRFHHIERALCVLKYFEPGTVVPVALPAYPLQLGDNRMNIEYLLSRICSPTLFRDHVLSNDCLSYTQLIRIRNRLTRAVEYGIVSPRSDVPGMHAHIDLLLKPFSPTKAFVCTHGAKIRDRILFMLMVKNRLALPGTKCAFPLKVLPTEMWLHVFHFLFSV